MNIDIPISTKSYIKKFIQANFGDDIKLSERNWLGIMIINILKRKSFQNASYEFKKMNDTYNDSITFKISLDKSYRYGVKLIPAQLYYINYSLDIMFKNEIIRNALINQSSYGIDFKTTILTTLEAYDITEDELNYETVRKHYNRNYKKFKTRMFL